MGRHPVSGHRYLDNESEKGPKGSPWWWLTVGGDKSTAALQPGQIRPGAAQRGRPKGGRR